MRTYQNMVYTTAFRLTANHAEAQDIAQETFLKAYERYDSLRDVPTAGGWLKTVATNLSLNHLSRYRKRWSFFSDLVRNADGADDRGGREDFAARTPAPESREAGAEAGGVAVDWLGELPGALPGTAGACPLSPPTAPALLSAPMASKVESSAAGSAAAAG